MRVLYALLLLALTGCASMRPAPVPPADYSQFMAAEVEYFAGRFVPRGTATVSITSDSVEFLDAVEQRMRASGFAVSGSGERYLSASTREVADGVLLQVDLDGLRSHRWYVLDAGGWSPASSWTRAMQ